MNPPPEFTHSSSKVWGPATSAGDVKNSAEYAVGPESMPWVQDPPSILTRKPRETESR